MTALEQKIKMIGKMAQEAGLMEDPQWLERLDQPVPLWVVLELLLKSIDRMESRNGPYD